VVQNVDLLSRDNGIMNLHLYCI